MIKQCSNKFATTNLQCLVNCQIELCLSFHYVEDRSQSNTWNMNFVCDKQVVERSFGLLQHHFPWVTFLRQRTLRKKVFIIVAACVLHNICIEEGDDFNEYLSEDIDDYRNVPPMPPINRQVATHAGLLKWQYLIQEIQRH